MVVLDFLSKRHPINVIYINHQTPHSEHVSLQADYLLRNYNVNYEEHRIDPRRHDGTSKEEHWRNERYKVFHKIDAPVITCHHLDDCIETWIWSSLHGEGKIIPFANRNVIRPFLSTRKEDFRRWADKKNVEYIDDPSNVDTKYIRNHIRHNMMEDVLKVNPGIAKVIRKKVVASCY